MQGTRIRLDSCGELDSGLSATALNPGQRLPSVVRGARPPWVIRARTSQAHTGSSWACEWLSSIPRFPRGAAPRLVRSWCKQRAAHWDPPEPSGTQGGRWRAKRGNYPTQLAGTASTHQERRLQGEHAARELGPSTHHEPQPGASALLRTPQAKAPAAWAPESSAVPSPARGQGRSRPGREAEGGAGLHESNWMIFAITHRRRAKSLRRPPGCAPRASPGAGILPSFVNSGRSAPPKLADVQLSGGQTRSGSAYQPSLLLLPLPYSVPLSEPALTQLPWCHPVEICHAQRLEWSSAHAGSTARAEAAAEPVGTRTQTCRARVTGLEDRGGVCGKVAPWVSVGRVGVVGIEPRTKSAVVAAQISSSVFSKGKQKVCLASSLCMCPGTVMDASCATRRMTRTPGTPEPQPPWESLGRPPDSSLNGEPPRGWRKARTVYGRKNLKENIILFGEEGGTRRPTKLTRKRQQLPSEKPRAIINPWPPFFTPFSGTNTIGCSGGDFLVSLTQGLPSLMKPFKSQEVQ